MAYALDAGGICLPSHYECKLLGREGVTGGELVKPKAHKSLIHKAILPVLWYACNAFMRYRLCKGGIYMEFRI